MTVIRFTEVGHLGMVMFGSRPEGDTITINVPAGMSDPERVARERFAEQLPDENGVEWAAEHLAEGGHVAGEGPVFRVGVD